MNGFDLLPLSYMLIEEISTNFLGFHLHLISIVVRIVTLILSVYSVFQFVFCLCSHAIHAQMEDSMFQQETAKGMRSAPEAAPKKASANVDDDFPIVSVSLLIILTS